VADCLWLNFSKGVTFSHHYEGPYAFIFAPKHAAEG
jgi:hypothetical protein